MSREELTVQRNLSVLLATALLVAVGALTVRDISVWAADDSDAVHKGLRLLVDTTTLARKYYVDDVDGEKMYEDAVQGMLQGLDRFSSFISEDDLAEFSKHVKGSFGGVGIVIGTDRMGRLMVISPIEDGPSFRAGVMAGDRIIKIEGKDTEGMSLDDAVKTLTGKPGTKVRFTVIHEYDPTEEERFTITREIIHVKTVKGMKRDDQGKWQYIVDPEEGVAYIRMTAFTEDTVADLHQALADAAAQGMKSLILDLRWNGGGMLDTAIGVVDTFLDEGVIVSTRGRNDPEDKRYATAGEPSYDIPMAILVNDRSASASEIVAGALQDHHRAIVVGERSFGKGSVQRVFQLNNGQCAVKLTVAKYYLPSGRCIHRTDDAEVWGVDPLIEVKMTPKQYADVFLARRDSEVLRVNGKALNGHGDGDDDGGDDVDEPTSDDGVDVGEPNDEAGDAEAAESDDAAEKDDEKSADLQLQRAIDALKMWPLLKQFGRVEAVVEATAN